MKWGRISNASDIGHWLEMTQLRGVQVGRAGASDPSTTNLMALAKLFGNDTGGAAGGRWSEAGESFRILSHFLNDQRGRAATSLWNTLRVWAIITCAFAAKRQRRAVALAAQTVKNQCCKFR